MKRRILVGVALLGRVLFRLAPGAVFAAALAMGAAEAQTTFSVDYQGPTASGVVADSFYGNLITSGDILSGPVGGPPIGQPGPGPLLPPGLVIHGGFPTAPPPGVPTLGLAPGQYGTPEVDAISFGHDEGFTIYFSVDEYALGDPVVPSYPPNVLSEGAFAFWNPGATSNLDASADVFRDIGGLVGMTLANPGSLIPGPGPPSPPAGNTAVLDGDGIVPTGLPGLGLTEPNPPSLVGPPDGGDNLDALDMDTTAADLSGRIYFSLDSGFVDPITGMPNSMTALINGYAGGDVLVYDLATGLLSVYATANQLGLDTLGYDTDDLDALALVDDGDGVFNPANDLLAFSIRRGSLSTLAMSGGAVPDSIFGVPIEEGDILVPPGTFGLVPGPTPGIAIPAEWLGLGALRSGVQGPFSDDLNALDLSTGPVIPEPAALLLAALGFWCLLMAGWRLRRTGRRAARS